MILTYFILVSQLYSFHIKFHHIQTSSLLDVYAIYTVKGIYDALATIGGDWVAHTLDDYLN